MTVLNEINGLIYYYIIIVLLLSNNKNAKKEVRTSARIGYAFLKAPKDISGPRVFFKIISFYRMALYL